MLTIICLFLCSLIEIREKLKKSQQTTKREENSTNINVVVNIPVPAQRRAF